MPSAVERLLLFWAEVVRSPRQVGSIIPSGQALGRAIARAVTATTPGYVVEIGAGTGAITEALATVSAKFDALSVVERSPRMTTALMQRFPRIEILVGCASMLMDRSFPKNRPLTVVSSIPFRSLPRDELHDMEQMITALSRHEGGFRFIQYSYSFGAPFRSPAPDLTWHRLRTVFANLPPATVWVLQKEVRLK